MCNIRATNIIIAEKFILRQRGRKADAVIAVLQVKMSVGDASLLF